MRKLTVGSLFSGIGGFDLGLERAGFEIEFQVENNDYCRRVLQKHWPAVPCHYDIRSIDWRYIPRVDVVCGGFPCQPFSCAGKRRGAEDDRYLWPEVVRCLAVLRPTWFLGENVPGLLHLGIEQVLSDLEALGYQTAVLGIPACGLDAPHIRQRLWFLANTKDVHGRWTSNPEHQRRRATKTRRCMRHAWPEGPRKVANIPRATDGLSHRLDRLDATGNAIVPQIAEALGRMILETDTYQPRGGE